MIVYLNLRCQVVVYDPASDGGLMRTAPLALDDEKVMQEDDVVTINFQVMILIIYLVLQR